MLLGTAAPKMFPSVVKNQEDVIYVCNTESGCKYFLLWARHAIFKIA